MPGACLTADHLSAVLPVLLLLGQRRDNSDVVDGEVTRLAVEGAVVPVLVNLTLQHDDVALLET